MTGKLVTAAVFAACAFASAGTASAGCVSKGAVATSFNESSAKWYALETMVQAVSWSLWPGYVATSKVAGYDVRNEKYVCKPDGGQVTCRGRASFCKK